LGVGYIFLIRHFIAGVLWLFVRLDGVGGRVFWSIGAVDEGVVYVQLWLEKSDEAESSLDTPSFY
jgi:hypothetical protein